MKGRVVGDAWPKKHLQLLYENISSRSQKAIALPSDTVVYQALVIDWMGEVNDRWPKKHSRLCKRTSPVVACEGPGPYRLAGRRTDKLIHATLPGKLEARADD